MVRLAVAVAVVAGQPLHVGTVGVMRYIRGISVDAAPDFSELIAPAPQAVLAHPLTVAGLALRAEQHQHAGESPLVDAAVAVDTFRDIMSSVDLFQAPPPPTDIVAEEAANAARIHEKGDTTFEKVLASAPHKDWVYLLLVCIVLLIFDFVVLQHGCSGSRTTLLPEVEKSLREIFLGCAPSAGGSPRAPRVAILAACEAHRESKAVFPNEVDFVAKLRTCKDETMSWEEFSCLYEEHLAHHSSKLPGNMKRHAAVLFFWLAVGAGYNLFVWRQHGTAAGVQWATGYALEWMLSMDNLFVFHLIFEAYATPRSMIHKALFLGIVGAAFFRMLFFVTLTTLLSYVHWVRFAFGALLIYSGIQAVMDSGDDEDVTDLAVVRCLKYMLGSRLLEYYDLKEHRMFVWIDSRLCATLLVPVVVTLEMTDILFAVDSVSAKVAQIPDYYLSYSSSLIAMFALRAMFFIIQDLVDCFELLKFGLCIILVFIGVELMGSSYIHVSPEAVCIMIFTVFLVCILGSAMYRRSHLAEESRHEKEHASPEAREF